MEEFVKVVLLGVIGMIFALLVGEKSPVFSLLVVIITSLSMVFLSFQILNEVISNVNDLISKAGLDFSVFLPVIKVSAIAIISKITSEICKDVGYLSLASKIQFAGSIISILVIFPLFTRIIEILQGIL